MLKMRLKEIINKNKNGLYAKYLYYRAGWVSKLLSGISYVEL